MSIGAKGEKTYHCEKSDKDVPIADPHCLNPKSYCKVRTACPIHALEKDFARESA